MVPLQTAVGGCRYGYSRPVWVQPSSSLTCAVQPQGPKGCCSLSANPNKAQAEPQRGMFAALLMARVDHTDVSGLVCLFVCVEETHFVVCSYESSGFHHAPESKRWAKRLFISSRDCLVY